MGTTFREATIDAAGHAMKELVIRGDAAEAQLAMAFMSKYLCDNYKISPEVFINTIFNNMCSLKDDASIVGRVHERIHNIVQEGVKKPALSIVSNDPDNDPNLVVKQDVGTLQRLGIHNPRTGAKQ